jgi:hypothetical protein
MSSVSSAGCIAVWMNLLGMTVRRKGAALAIENVFGIRACGVTTGVSTFFPERHDD